MDVIGLPFTILISSLDLRVNARLATVEDIVIDTCRHKFFEIMKNSFVKAWDQSKRYAGRIAIAGTTPLRSGFALMAKLVIQQTPPDQKVVQYVTDHKFLVT